MVVMTAMFGVMGVAVNVQANVAMAGDLIKSTSSPAVYYLDSNLVRHPFHHAREYFTWYNDFAGVKTISTDEMVSYGTPGSTVVVRPGSRLVQFVEVLGDGTWSTSNTPYVYALGPNGEIHAIDSAATAVAKFGSNWEFMIVPLPNYLTSNYATGSAFTSSSMYPAGTLVKTADATQVYYIDGSSKRPVTDAGFTANRLNMNYVLTVSDLSAYSAGSSITAMESEIANPMSGAVTGGIVSGSGLTATVASDSPGAQVAPISATNVPLMKFNLTAASDGAVSVSSVSIKRLGVGSSADFTYIYLYDGAKRLTTGRTINSSSNIAQFSNLGLTVPAGTTKTLTLSADISTGTAGNFSYFQILSSDVSASAVVNGSFPLMSNTTTIGSSQAGSVTITRSGTLSNPSVGQQNVKIAEFKMAAGTREDLSIRRLTLYEAGTLNNNYLTNLKLYQNNVLLATAASVDSKGYVVFDLSVNPFILSKNTNRIFTVSADISGSGRDGDTIVTYVEQTTDVYAVGLSYGFGAAVDINGTTGDDTDGYDGSSTNSEYSTVTVQGGEITVAMNGPVASTITRGTTDATFMNFSLTSGVNAEIRSMQLEIHASSTDLDTDDANCSTYITNVRIVDVDSGESTSAVDCSSFTNVNSTNGGVKYPFTDYFTLTAGQTRNFAVKMDLSSNTSLTAQDYYVILGSSYSSYYTFSSTAIKNTDNNQYIVAADIVPNTFSQGNNQTVAPAGLYASLASNAAANTVVQGTSGVNFGDFALRALSGSDITISGITMTGYVDGDGAGSTSTMAAGSVADVQEAGMAAVGTVYANNLVTNLKIYDTTTDPNKTTNLNSSVQSMNTSGVASFSNVNWTIPAGETHILRAVGDTSNTAYANGVSGDKHVKIRVATAANASVQDADGSAVNLTLTANNGVATTMGSSYYVTVTNSGTLNVTAESNPPIANVIAGASMVPVLNLRFQAANEAFNVNKLNVDQLFSSSTDRAVLSAVISYQNQAGTTVTASQTLISGAANFNITANPLYVPANSYRIVNVYYNLASINQTYAAYTGDLVRASFDANDNFEAKSAGSGSTSLVATSNVATVATVTGTNMHIHGALPSFEADLQANFQLLAPGPADLYRFRVDAAEGGTDVGLKKLSFKLSMTDSVKTTATLSLTNFQILEGTSYNNAAALTQANTGTDSYAIYNGWGATSSNASGTSGGKLSVSSGVVYQNIDGDGAAGASASSTRDVILVFNDDRLITAGNSKYYILRATAGNVDNGTNGNTDSIGVYLYDGDTATGGTAKYLEPTCDGSAVNKAPGRYCLGTSVTAGDSGAYILWSDNTGVNGNGAHADVNSETSVATYDGTAVTASSDWFNGYKLKTLDVQRSLN